MLQLRCILASFWQEESSAGSDEEVVFKVNMLSDWCSIGIER
jgi:hypothetical protein